MIIIELDDSNWEAGRRRTEWEARAAAEAWRSLACLHSERKMELKKKLWTSEKWERKEKVFIYIEEGKPKLHQVFGVLGTETNIKLKMRIKTAVGKEEVTRWHLSDVHSRKLERRSHSGEKSPRGVLWLEKWYYRAAWGMPWPWVKCQPKRLGYCRNLGD